MPSASAVWLALLTVSGACSIHSLDYLSEAGTGASSGQGATSTGGTPSAGGGIGAQGGVDARAGAGAGATDAMPSDAGAAGVGIGGTVGIPPEMADCDDTQTTVDETDIDCGGRTCEPCAADKRCITGTDCQSGICTNQVCQAPTCTDIAVNGDETDLNCGGSCPPCDEAQHCKINSDCSTNECTKGMCESTVCEDGVLQDGCPLLVNATPYSLSPAHAPTRCLDDNQLSVVEGTGMVLYPCKVELQQTFWAIARPGGYFAFRNALSAKCLQVRDASKAEDAVVEQADCDYAAQQLWKPARVDASVMQLTNRLSGLALDVSGSNVDADAQPITQGKVDGGDDTHWRLQKRSSAAYITLSPSDDASNYLQHTASSVTLQPKGEPNAQWKVVPGLLNPQFVSFQSRDEPGRYLRHSGFKLWADTNDGSSQFKADATFVYDHPFVGDNLLTKALKANNFQDHFLRRIESAVSLIKFEDSAAYKASATWTIGTR